MAAQEEAPPTQQQPVVVDKAAAAVLKKEGNELYKKKDFEGALKKYDEALKQDPTDATYLNNKCAVYLEMGDFEAVYREGQAAVELGRSQRAEFEFLAKVYARMARAAEKQNEVDKALEYYSSAQVEHYSKEVERAVKLLELERRKAKAKAYVNKEEGAAAKERGNDFFRSGKFPDAVYQYEDACKRDPENPAYQNNLAAALSKIGDFQGAKRATEKALELDPKYVKAYGKRGDLEFHAKEYHKAMESYKKGLAVDPANAACKAGLQKVQTAIAAGGDDAERRAHAMADPEIQAILQDPEVRTVLQTLSTQPDKAQAALADATVRAKIDKLIASGILQVK